ncbi:MAG: D-glycero-beta-D-manno-heptose-7-phosphate kinase [Proteobacteria bacterium]|nr:D-glycero-beta-D-manno-heptose-7-phosphate kinase [Pseudomonadota bacterium]
MSDVALLDVLACFAEARVTVLGDVMLDRFLYGSVERVSPEAPVPVIALQRTANMPGGAANVARNVAALGAQVVLIGVVGEDEAATELRALLAGSTSFRTHLTVDASRPTTTKTRYIADQQQILRTDREVSAALSEPVAAAVLKEFSAALAATDIVILSDYGKGALSDAVAAQAIAAASAAGKQVLVDPKSRSFAKYAGATVLTPNMHELQLASGRECTTDEQVEAAATAVISRGICETVIATRGKDGMSIIQKHAAPLHIRTVANEVYDVTGAGDTAVAAMAVALASGADMRSAARVANLAAGIVVGKYGTATATRDEILARLGGAEADDHSVTSYTLERVQVLLTRWRRLGLSIAFTNGCFDMLHPGHVSLLKQAKLAADRLIVGLNSDKSIRRLKGPSRPIQSAESRALVLSSLRAVDAVVVFEEDTPLNLIAAIEPDVLVKGADYTVETVVGADLVLARGGRVLLADLVPAHSTTETIRRIAAAKEA